MNSQAEVEEQWETLDLGDSELPSFLRPCKRKSLNPCSSRDYSSLVPGPAGSVQIAIRRKMNKDPRSFNEEGEPIPTQEFIRKAAEESDLGEDKDFSGDLWVSTVDYVRNEGLLSNGGNAIGTPLSEIKRRCGNWGKVDQVVAIIKTCTPNGLGDVMVTLKDPTGTIDASVHRKVISDSEFGKDIRVGSVMILKKVAVCTPSRSSCYLNITLKNISKVITKDTPVSPNQIDSETNAKNPANSRMQQAQGMLENTTQGIMNNLRKNVIGDCEARLNDEQEENVMENSNEVTTQTMVSTSSMPHWTDEQLEELFAFD